MGDFDGLSAAELAEYLVVEPREAQKLLAQVRSSLEVQPRDLKTKSALQLLNEERASTPITTFVKELDNLLGGGVALGQLTGARLCQGAGGGLMQCRNYTSPTPRHTRVTSSGPPAGCNTDVPRGRGSHMQPVFSPRRGGIPEWAPGFGACDAPG